MLGIESYQQIGIITQLSELCDTALQLYCAKNNPILGLVVNQPTVV